MSLTISSIDFSNLSISDIEEMIHKYDTVSGENRELVLQLIDIVNSLYRDQREMEALDRLVELESAQLESLEFTDWNEVESAIERWDEELSNCEYVDLVEGYLDSSPKDNTYYAVKKEFTKQAMRARIRKNPLRALTTPVSVFF